MTLVAVSVIGSFIEVVIDLQYIGLLGLLPIYIGIKNGVSLLKGDDAEDPETSPSLNNRAVGTAGAVFFVAGVTIANGGDNISIYIPLFATLGLGNKMIMVFIFLMMTGIWCLLAYYLSNHSLIKRSLEKYAHIVTPFVFILLGIYILYESGALNLIR
jgi:cadmium resistance protein CadD (predicted permease)